jgi:hypothetical protein
MWHVSLPQCSRTGGRLARGRPLRRDHHSFRHVKMVRGTHSWFPKYVLSSLESPGLVLRWRPQGSRGQPSDADAPGPWSLPPYSDLGLSVDGAAQVR